MIRFAHATSVIVLASLLVAAASGSDPVASPGQRPSASPTAPRRSIEIEVGVSGRVSSLKMQSWSERLAGLKVDHIRIRQALPDDKISISEQEIGRASMVRVFGMLDDRGRLNVPGHTFSEQDSQGLAQWIDDLRRYGPKGSPVGKPAWGLSDDQLAALRKSLSVPATASEGETLAQLMERFAAETHLEVAFEAGAPEPREVPDHATAIPSDAKGLSWGTWMAFVLAERDLALEPERTPGDTVRLRIAPADVIVDPLPLGAPPPVRNVKLVPKLFEFITFEISNVPLSTVLAEVETRLGVPILVDRPALRYAGIDPDQLLVSLPPKRGTWLTNLRKVMFQGKLSSELRVDEAGTPFLWVTTLKTPVRRSPP